MRKSMVIAVGLGMVMAVAVALAWAGQGGPASLPAEGPASQPREVEMSTQDSNTLSLGYGSSQWLYPLDAPREKMAKEPKYKSARPVYYAAVLGDAADNVHTLVIDESGGTGKGYDTLYVDADNDNRITGQGETMPFSMSTVRTSVPVRLKFQVSAGGKVYPYWVSFTAFAYKDEKNLVEKIHANLRNASYRTGQAVICGKMHKIALADLNSNGLFTDPEGGGTFTGDRFFVDLNDDGSFRDDRSEDGSSGVGCGQYMKIGGRWHTVVASPCGDRITIAPASPPLGQVQAPAMVGEARLASPRQGCVLHFKDGLAEAVAGEYEIAVVRLAVKDSAGQEFATYASFPREAGPKVTVRQGRKAVLPAVGPPLVIETPVSSAEDGAMVIGLRITGVAGEEHLWLRAGKGAGFEIRDASGKVVDSGQFAFG